MITPHPCHGPDPSPIDCPTGDAASQRETGGRGKLIVMRQAHVIGEGMPFGTISEHDDEGGQHTTHDAADDEPCHVGSHEGLLSGLVVLPMQVSCVYDRYTFCHNI
jgi:hypothetical protein